RHVRHAEILGYDLPVIVDLKEVAQWARHYRGLILPLSNDAVGTEYIVSRCEKVPIRPGHIDAHLAPATIVGHGGGLAPLTNLRIGDRQRSAATRRAIVE